MPKPKIVSFEISDWHEYLNSKSKIIKKAETNFGFKNKKMVS
jgi:hypothetical protein